MTKDTERALEIIAPMAKELNIEVSADERFLYCNGQAIGISCNSAYATVTEFVNYAFYFLWKKWKHERLPNAVVSSIQRYWFSEEQIKKFREERKANDADGQKALPG